MEYIDLGPYKSASGTIRIPGSKSISNRVLLLAALSEGNTTIKNLLDSDDTRVMLDALEKLGVCIKSNGDTCVITGIQGKFTTRSADLFLNNAGTVVRPLTAILSVNNGDYRIYGIDRMHERPIGDLVDGLRQIGANINYEQNNGFLPLHIHPADTISINGPIQIHGDVSSQFLTALLMTIPLLKNTKDSQVVIEILGDLISKPYIDITIKLMARFGVHVECANWKNFIVPTGISYQSPGYIMVEGDASSASYFLAAGAFGGGPLRVEGIGNESIQGDIAFAHILARMGANVIMGDNWIEVHGMTSRGRGKLHSVDMDFNMMPDAAMTIAIASLFADGISTLHNIASWRVKETDRIIAMAAELRKVGAIVEEGKDRLIITPPKKLIQNASIDTYNDHRIAMCFSLVSLGGVSVRINNPKCVSKTFPNYFGYFMAIVKY
ncbi:MAG: 3-phosphoshikimate 1-carboxyvinyltransferase [Burkholderia sp.]|nr:3-phosphoshikimate 1-carboxyvinyltransferase [Burkholderia sp.]